MDKKLNKIIKILTITDYRIIGSKGDPNINDNVISDIDLQDLNTNNNYEDILKHFQEVFETLKKSSNMIIADFKCGYNNNTNRSYRWIYKTIMRGYQYDEENNKVYFIDELKKYSIIKIDVVLKFNEDIIEITMNYFIKGTFKRQTTKDIIKKLKDDINKYNKDGNYYKALKRLISIYRLNKKQNTKKYKKVVDIINSEYGLMARDKSRLETLLLLMKYYPSSLNLTKIKNKYNVRTKQDVFNRIEEYNKKINDSYLKTFLNNLI